MKAKIPPPVQGFVAGFIMWLLARAAPLATFDFPGRGKLAVALMALGLLIDLIAIASFARAKTTVSPLRPDNASSLVTGGLYRFSRNPMYAGLLILLIGWFFRLGAASPAVILALFVAAITILQIKPEERALEAKFGEPYRDYKRRVRRWI